MVTALVVARRAAPFAACAAAWLAPISVLVLSMGAMMVGLFLVNIAVRAVDAYPIASYLAVLVGCGVSITSSKQCRKVAIVAVVCTCCACCLHYAELAEISTARGICIDTNVSAIDASLWELVPHIVVLNMISRPDRLKHILSVLDCMGVKNMSKVYVHHPTGKQHGDIYDMAVTRSYLEMFSTVRRRTNGTWMLVLEDDVDFTADGWPLLRDAFYLFQQEASRPEKERTWDYLNLGGWPLFYDDNQDSKGRFVHGMHALTEGVLYTPHMIDSMLERGSEMIEASRQGMMFDKQLNAMYRPLVTLPPVAYQQMELAYMSNNTDNPQWFSVFILALMRCAGVTYHTVGINAARMAAIFSIFPSTYVREAVLSFL